MQVDGIYELYCLVNIGRGIDIEIYIAMFSDGGQTTELYQRFNNFTSGGKKFDEQKSPLCHQLEAFKKSAIAKRIANTDCGRNCINRVIIELIPITFFSFAI